MASQYHLLTQAEAASRRACLGAIHYTINLEFSSNAEYYQAASMLEFEYQPKELKELRLDFIFHDLQWFELNGSRPEIRQEAGALFIPTNQLKTGMNVFTCKYANKYDHTGSGVHRFIDPMDQREYIYTDFEPFDAHRLLPCFDQPDLKATFQVTVSGPKEWLFIHNAPKTNESVDSIQNIKKIIFKKTARFSTYLLSIIAGDFAYFQDIYKGIANFSQPVPLGIYCRKSLTSYLDRENIFSLTKESFAFLEQFFAYPYPYYKYDQIFVPEFNFGAMENVACITFSEHYLFRHKPLYSDLLNRANTITHEMVHMWFGDLVTMQWWNDLWLNESFADYLSYYAMSKGTLFSDAMEHFSKRKEWAYYQDQLSTTHPVAATAKDTEEAFSNFDGISYTKGAALLRQLQYAISETQFQKGMALYMHRFAEKNTTLPDFLQVMTEMNQANDSHFDISKWSNIWLTTTGVNTVYFDQTEPNLIRQKPSHFSKEINILRSHAIEISLFHWDGNHLTAPIKPDLARNKIVIEGETHALPIANSNYFYLLNVGDYGYLKCYLPQIVIKNFIKIIPQIEQRFDRRVVWNSLWQMVLDAEISMIFFLQVFVALAHTETDVTVLEEDMIQPVIKIFQFFLPEEYQLEWSRKLQTLAWKNLGRNIHDDFKSLFFRLAIHTAIEETDLNSLHDILIGTLNYNGLEIDQEKRWDILIRLSAFDHSQAEALSQKEKERDKSDLGEKKFFQTNVARPDKQNKKAIWQQFNQPSGDYSVDFLRYGMQTFHWRHQADILQEFTELYFHTLIEIYYQDDLHYKSAFGRFLYPKSESIDKLLTLTKAALAKTEVKNNFLLQKQLIEFQDNYFQLQSMRQKI